MKPCEIQYLVTSSLGRSHAAATEEFVLLHFQKFENEGFPSTSLGGGHATFVHHGACHYAFTMMLTSPLPLRCMGGSHLYGHGSL